MSALEGGSTCSFLENWRNPPLQVLDVVWPAEQVIKAWPFRSCGFHLCYSNRALRPFLKAVNMVAGRETRLRERTHFGSEIEVQYSLMTFGINLPNAFKAGKGVLSDDCIESYLNKRWQNEAEWMRQFQNRRDADSESVEYPGEFDVLVGRGLNPRSWIGNQRYLALIHDYVDRYKESGQERLEKTMMTIDIVHRVQLNGGRFIERKISGWMMITDQMAAEKVSQFLRVEVKRRKTESADLPPK